MLSSRNQERKDSERQARYSLDSRHGSSLAPQVQQAEPILKFIEEETITSDRASGNGEEILLLLQ